MLDGKRILLIVSGGIAAVKVPDLLRRLRAEGASVTPVMTRAAEQFVTPLSLAALAEARVYTALFDLTDEAEMGHIQLSRSADLVVVAPGTADLLAKMATGAADDLASTLLLATYTPVMVAPAMNVRMWEHPATRRNVQVLRGDGVRFVGPAAGAMACGEFGDGRMSEPAEIVEAMRAHFAGGRLAGRHVLVTSGPTHEPIDSVRYIANRSSGAQGTAIAAACRDLGARVTFVTGPASVPPPSGVAVVAVETAREMMDAVAAALPADVFVGAAAVADWHVVDAGT
ncbi:MAG: bifunctional phosphopantothenoylcysteine decarboxylase/phosphopantothenate--cysteine ligase CoaBC, partial [Shimia sp.]